MANCRTNGPDQVARLFKSFMEFDGGPGNPLFHDWELSSDHRIGGAVTQIDRSAAILQRREMARARRYRSCLKRTVEERFAPFLPV